MRIITGSAKGTRLETLEGDDITRPTGERVKEAIFSMIQFDIEGRKVLDLFGGSGQLALEALSRGAALAVICDADKRATDIIKKNAQKTKLYEKTRILTTDCKNLLKSFSGKERFDLVFLDPPYATSLIYETLPLLIKYDLLNRSAHVVCESDRQDAFSCEGLELKRFYKYGKVYITLLRKGSEIYEESADNGQL